MTVSYEKFPSKVVKYILENTSLDTLELYGKMIKIGNSIGGRPQYFSEIDETPFMRQKHWCNGYLRHLKFEYVALTNNVVSKIVENCPGLKICYPI